MFVFSAEDIPTFPVDSDMFVSVKKRVQVARELDKLKLELRKEVRKQKPLFEQNKKSRI